MTSIEFEGWGVKLKDISNLNQSKEVSRIGLVFEQLGDCISAYAVGNVSNYYGILAEVKSQINHGGFNIVVEMSTGEKSKILLSSKYVIENEKDISSIFGFS